MKITRYNASGQCGDEIADEYGVVSEDGTRALRIQANDYVDTTIIGTITAYAGKDLTFTGQTLSGTSAPQQPKDSEDRYSRLTFEVTPPLSDIEERQKAVAAYAGVVLKLEQEGALEMDMAAVPGTVQVSLKVSPDPIPPTYNMS